MSKASRFLKFINEEISIPNSPVTQGEQVAKGKAVIFKKGHPYEGLIARVISYNDKNKTVDVTIGGALRVGISMKDVVLADEPKVGAKK